jgi:hypothetical protein
VADDGKEFALRAVGRFGGLFGKDESGLGFFALRDIVADRLIFEKAAGGLDGTLGPEEPAAAVVR